MQMRKECWIYYLVMQMQMCHIVTIHIQNIISLADVCGNVNTHGKPSVSLNSVLN